MERRPRIDKAPHKRPPHCEACHTPGKVQLNYSQEEDRAQGWLCAECCAILDGIRHDPRRLRALAAYLK